jgi:predicted DsbA family dithiol-disulfide isomerase
VVCPWCFIGKRRLDAALRLYAAEGMSSPTVRWRPYQLNPEVPASGVDRNRYVTEQFGIAGRDRIYTRVKAIGRQVGINFVFDKILRQPNTLAAHSLIALAESYENQSDLVEVLFNAFFVDCLDLTDDAVLLALSVNAGLPEKAAKSTLASADVRKRVTAQELEARKLGVQGAPLFIFNNKIQLSGAQEPEALLRAMKDSNGDMAAA